MSATGKQGCAIRGRVACLPGRLALQENPEPFFSVSRQAHRETWFRGALQVAIAILLLVTQLTEPAVAETRGKLDSSRPIRVLRPRELPATLPAGRLQVGPGYKPSLARLPNGELVMMFFTWERREGFYHEHAKLCRSIDQGTSWSDPVRVELGPGKDLLGRENWLTAIDDGSPHGLLFTTNHIIRVDAENPTPGTCRATINRSTDGGISWTQTVLPVKWSHTSRNVVQMPDGSLKVGANNVTGGNNRWLTSTDQGLRWQESRLKLPAYTNYQGERMDYANAVGFFQESFTYVNDARDLLQWIRLDRHSPMYAVHPDQPTGNDNVDRLLFTRSADGGVTWSDVQDFPPYSGDLEAYGQMYPRVIELQDSRVLMTFTRRSVTPPLGLRAVLSTDGGHTFDFSNDHLILDENTEVGWTSGGGFGNTIQLPCGGLISVYSYATTPQGNAHPRVEIVQWRLP